MLKGLNQEHKERTVACLILGTAYWGNPSEEAFDLYCLRHFVPLWGRAYIFDSRGLWTPIRRLRHVHITWLAQLTFEYSIGWTHSWRTYVKFLLSKKSTRTWHVCKTQRRKSKVCGAGFNLIIYGRHVWWGDTNEYLHRLLEWYLILFSLLKTSWMAVPLKIKFIWMGDRFSKIRRKRITFAKVLSECNISDAQFILSCDRFYQPLDCNYRTYFY